MPKPKFRFHFLIKYAAKALSILLKYKIRFMKNGQFI